MKLWIFVEINNKKSTRKSGKYRNKSRSQILKVQWIDKRAQTAKRWRNSDERKPYEIDETIYYRMKSIIIMRIDTGLPRTQMAIVSSLFTFQFI